MGIPALPLQVAEIHDFKASVGNEQKSDVIRAGASPPVFVAEHIPVLSDSTFLRGSHQANKNTSAQ